MRPTRLELEGFISFRERTTVDFSSLDLFGITGPTGAGKTSLLDSIIFALYGKTPRLGEKAVQELISQGAAQMRVMLEFRSGPEEFRVLRLVKRKGSSRTQIERRTGDDWHPVADSTRELRERVSEIVGLDFDAFTKTVVLPQGQFDRFLRGDAGARRRILSDLLGLDVYERMMKRANEIARDAKHDLGTLNEWLATQAATLSADQLEALDHQIKDAAQAREIQATELASLERALPMSIALRECTAQAAQYQQDRDACRKALETAANAVAVSRKRLADLHQELAQGAYDDARHLQLKSLLPVAERQMQLRGGISSIESRLSASRESDRTMAESIDKARKDWEDLASAEQQRNAAAAALTAWREFRNLHGSADLLTAAAREAVSLDRQCASTTAAVKSAEVRVQDLRSHHDVAVENAGNARRRLDEVRVRHAAAHVRQHLHAGEPCPVCEQPVSVLPQQLQPGDADAASALAAYNEAESQLKRSQQDLAKAETDLEVLRRRLAADSARRDAIANAGQLPALAAQAKLLETAATTAEALSRKAGEAESAARTKLAGLVNQHTLLRAAAESAERELAERTAELASHPPLDMEALRAEDDALNRARDRHQKLTRDLQLIDRAIAKGEVDERNASERLASLSASLKGLEERAGTLTARLSGLGIAVDADLETRITAARKQLQQLDTALAESRSLRQTQTEKATEAAKLRERAAQLEVDAETHSRLGILLRSDQFGAWILKDAFARLAYEGSRQLEALSNGRYTFASDGGDFAVCDRWNAGERRSVNTLSGGESFLASLSLALALSRSLPDFAANRDRFHLDSLFLDEGFSTLDAETLNTVLEAMELLQADGRLIGVISHAPELADRLPGRIEVVKGPTGSRIHLR